MFKLFRNEKDFRFLSFQTTIDMHCKPGPFCQHVNSLNCSPAGLSLSLKQAIDTSGKPFMPYVHCSQSICVHVKVFYYPCGMNIYIYIYNLNLHTYTCVLLLLLLLYRLLLVCNIYKAFSFEWQIVLLNLLKDNFQ